MSWWRCWLQIQCYRMHFARFWVGLNNRPEVNKFVSSCVFQLINMMSIEVELTFSTQRASDSFKTSVKRASIKVFYCRSIGSNFRFFICSYSHTNPRKRKDLLAKNVLSSFPMQSFSYLSHSAINNQLSIFPISFQNWNILFLLILTITFLSKYKNSEDVHWWG